jgi:hypothetical protein
MKMNRIRWAGHVWRMLNNMPAKIVLDSQPYSDGIRNVRPKIRWIDGVLKDLKSLGVRNEKSAALDRSKWRRSCRRPRPYQVCMYSVYIYLPPLFVHLSFHKFVHCLVKLTKFSSTKIGTKSKIDPIKICIIANRCVVIPLVLTLIKVK